MSLTFDCLPGGHLRRLVVYLCLTSPLLVHAQGLTLPTPADNPSATDTSDSSSGFSSARSFRPYSGEKSQNRVPAMQPEFADSSGFNWTQFFKSAAETGSRLAAPRLFMNNGQNGMGGGTLFHAGSGSNGTLGDSFNLTSRGVNFSSKSSALDLHLSLQSMFPNGLSPRGGGSSFAGSGWGTTGAGGLGTPDGLGSAGGLGNPGGLGSMGGRDAQKGSGARVSLQLKF
jgi:hypothetical protein